MEPWHTAVLPETVPGVAGMAVTEMAVVCAKEAPQLLLAVTVMFPLVLPATVLMVLVEELPLHPEGNVQV